VLAALAVAAILPAMPCLSSPPGTSLPVTTSQAILVVAPSARSTRAEVRLWSKEEGCWRPTGDSWAGRVGRNGVASTRREGDGTTPAGVFALGRTIYGVAPDPGVSYPYHRLVCGDWWDGDSRSRTYNRFRHVRCGTTPPFAGASEALWRQKRAYRHFAEIRYNAAPPRPGLGSAIFLHADTGRATAGCVSLPPRHLVTTLRWLRAEARPRIAIGVAA
jgi:L,D-peptidoglycan transpeptidase YkuD (ErfK/YbiS/YcfS/YnhG family)